MAARRVWRRKKPTYSGAFFSKLNREESGRAIKKIVGAQVSSLRPYLQTPQELRASLQKAGGYGYRTVQMQWWNPEFEPELVAAAVRGAGLTCVSTQDLYTAVRDDFERTVRLNVLCGSTCVCVSGIPAPVPDTASVLAFSAELAAMAARIAPLGMTLAFHPRAREWAPADTAEPGLSCTELLSEFTPQNVTLGWTCTTPAKRVSRQTHRRAAAGRGIQHLRLLHRPDGLKRCARGQGVTDWSAAVDACRETGVRWAFAEQERWEKDAFLCMRESLDAMRLGL